VPKPKHFRMPLVCLGTHQAPQQSVNVTPERAHHWIESHRQITAERNKIPMPWGHQLKAVPYGDADARRYAMARWNAGSVVDLEFDPATGWVDAIATVPPGYEVETDGAGKLTGRLVNPTDHTVIEEMSAGIGNWKDGKGKVWRDIIVHAALCTLPVVAGQPGVTAALSADPDALLDATMGTDGVEYLYTLGTATMADDKDPAKKPKADKPADAPPDKPKAAGLGDLESDLGMDDLPPVPPTEGLPTEMPAAPAAATPTPLPSVSPDAQAITDCLSYATALGLPMPADTTPQNFTERLKVAMSTAAALGFKLMNPQQSQQQPDAQIQTGTEGAQPDPMAPNAAYMSTEPGQTVTLSADAGVMAETWAQADREAIARRITEFEKAGHLPADVAKEERDRLPGYKPAIDPVTKRVTVPEGRRQLSLIARMAGQRADVTAKLTGRPVVPETVTLSTAAEAVPEPNPAREAHAERATPKADPEYVKFLANYANLEMKNGAA
jgi:hypothetical protein